MDLNDLNLLVGTGKTNLVLHALEIWEKEWSSNPEVLLEALKYEEKGTLEIALNLAASYHPRSCGSRISNLLNSQNETVRRLAVQSLSPKMGTIAEKSLKKLLAVESDVFVLASAVSAAARFNLDVSLVEKFLTHPDIRLRANTVRATSVIGRSRLRELLEPRLKDDAFRVQNEALKGLSQLIPETELETLVTKRLASPDANIRASTAFLIGELPITRKVGLLVEALKDTDAKVVLCSIRALSKLNEPLGMRAVINLYLQIEDDEFAESLARIIAKNGCERLLSIAERNAHPVKASELVVTRVLLVAKNAKNWEPFLPWIIVALKICIGSKRVVALKMVLSQIDYFKHDVERLFSGSSSDFSPLELAYCSLIRWKAGMASGFEELKEMLFSGRSSDIMAAVEVFRFDNSLISRNCLKQAVDSGIVLAIDSQTGALEKDIAPIELPEE